MDDGGDRVVRHLRGGNVQRTQERQLREHGGDGGVRELAALGELEHLQRRQVLEVLERLVRQQAAAANVQLAQLRHGGARVAYAIVGDAEAAANVEAREGRQRPPALEARVRDLVAVGDREHVELAQRGEARRAVVAHLAPAHVQLLEVRRHLGGDRARGGVAQAMACVEVEVHERQCGERADAGVREAGAHGDTQPAQARERH